MPTTTTQGTIAAADVKADQAAAKVKQHENDRDNALRRGDINAAYGYQRAAEQAREETTRWLTLGDRIIYLTHPDRQPPEETTRWLTLGDRIIYLTHPDRQPPEETSQ